MQFLYLRIVHIIMDFFFIPNTVWGGLMGVSVVLLPVLVAKVAQDVFFLTNHRA